MAQIKQTAKLVRLRDTELTVAHPAEDFRDREEGVRREVP